MNRTRVVYKFEGVVKSSPTEEGFEFRIVPTSKYKVTSSVCGKTVDAYVAFMGYEPKKVVAINETPFTIKYPKRQGGELVPSCAFLWLCSHSDTDYAMTFLVDKNGALLYPKDLRTNKTAQISKSKKSHNAKQ